MRYLLRAASLLLFVAPLAAQNFPPAPAGPPTFPTTDPVLKQIWAAGMEHSQTWPLAQALLDSVGPRLHGSPGIRSGHEWLAARYAQFGITARNEQYGTWKGWRRGITHVDLIRPRVRTLEAVALAMSAPTKGEVTGSVVVWPAVADSAALKAWLATVKGKFIAISMPQPTCRPDDSWEKWATPASVDSMKKQRTAATAAWVERFSKAGVPAGRGVQGRAVASLLENAGAAGILTSLWSAGWGVDKIFNAYSEKIPTLDVMCEDYGLVTRLSERNQSPELRVRVDAEFLGDVPVVNTIATIPGEKADEFVLLSAHFDSWDGGSGATDNGTGTITMLEAMRILKSVYPKPKRTILVGHWSGEEWGLLGSQSFAADHPEVVKGLQAQFNQDNGTGRIVNFGGAGLLTSGAHVADWFSRLPDTFMRQVTLSFPGSPAGGGSDNASFACYGAPAFGLGSISADYFNYTWHTNRDTFDKIVFDDLKANATMTAMLAYLAAEDPVKMERMRREPAANPFTGRTTPWPECAKPARSWAENTR